MKATVKFCSVWTWSGSRSSPQRELGRLRPARRAEEPNRSLLVYSTYAFTALLFVSVFGLHTARCLATVFSFAAYIVGLILVVAIFVTLFFGDLTDIGSA